VISRCLEYEPDKRWSSAREVEEALFGPDAARRSAGARKWSARGTLAVAILAMLLTSAIVWGSIWYATGRPVRRIPTASSWWCCRSKIRERIRVTRHSAMGLLEILTSARVGNQRAAEIVFGDPGK